MSHVNSVPPTVHGVADLSTGNPTTADSKGPVAGSLESVKQKSAHERVRQAIDEINKNLQNDNQEVVFEFDPRANRVWLNVIDTSTGKVLEEMPPKIIRDLVDSLGSIKGLIVDTHS